MLAPSASDGSLLGRVRRVLGVAPAPEKQTGGLAGSLALAAVAIVGFTLFFTPGTTQAKADVESPYLINGSVVTAEGQPVAGADVWLVAGRMQSDGAETLGKTRTGADGRFRLTISDDKHADRNLGWRSLWVHKAGLQPASVLPEDDAKPFADQSIKITLDRPVSANFRLLDPAGMPAAGCKVAVVFLNDGRTTLPDELSDRLSETSDAGGNVVMHVVAPDSIRMVRTNSSAFGTQYFHLRKPRFKSGAELKLSPVASVEGWITADDPAAVRGVLVHLDTRRGDWSELNGQGQATVRTDERGRFAVSKLVAGRLSVWPLLAEDTQYGAVSVEERELAAGSRTTIEIPLKRLIRVRGIVRAGVWQAD